MDNPYSRIYWGVMDDPKFEGIIGNPSLFGAWALMLLVADRAYPDPAFIPTVIPRAAVVALSDAHLVEVMSGRRYRIHGLEAERLKRSQYARNAAAVRWHSEGNADASAEHSEGNAQPMLGKGLGKGLEPERVNGAVEEPRRAPHRPVDPS